MGRKDNEALEPIIQAMKAIRDPGTNSIKCLISQIIFPGLYINKLGIVIITLTVA